MINTEMIYEVQKYCSLTNHMWDGFWFLVNRRLWQGLPADLREIVSTHINASALQERIDVAGEQRWIPRTDAWQIGGGRLLSTR